MRIIISFALLVLSTSVLAFKVNNQSHYPLHVNFDYNLWLFSRDYDVAPMQSNFEVTDMTDPSIYADYEVKGEDDMYYYTWRFSDRSDVSIVVRKNPTLGQLSLYCNEQLVGS